MLKNIINLTIILLYFGCSTTTKTNELNPLAYNPKSKPIINETSFSEAVKCIDLVAGSILAKQNKRIAVYCQNFPNRTPNSKIPQSARDMLYTVLSEMGKYSERIRVFEFTDSSPNNSSRKLTVPDLHMGATLLIFKTLNKPGFEVLRIDASVTQAPAKVLKKENELDLELPSIFEKFFSNYGGEKSLEMSTIAIDMRMVYSETSMLVPGVNSRNIISVFKTDKYWDLVAGHIKYGNVSFCMDLSQREDMGAAQRVLIELGAIQLINKYIQKEFGSSAFEKCEKCLIPSERNALMNEAKRELDLIKTKQQYAIIQKSTQKNNNLKGRKQKKIANIKKKSRSFSNNSKKVNVQLKKFVTPKASLAFYRIINSLKNKGVKDIKLSTSKNSGHLYSLWNVVVEKKLSPLRFQDLIMKKIDYVLKSGGKNFSAEELIILNKIEIENQIGGKNDCLYFIVR